MRVRSGRFNKSARTTKLVGSGSVTLSLDPKVFDADQALGFQPRVGQTLLQGWGSGHVPIAVATDAMLDRSFQTDAQGSQISNLGTRPAPLFPVAHAHAAPQPLVQLRDRLVVLADANGTGAGLGSRDWSQVLLVAIGKQHSPRAKPHSESRQASGKT